MRSSCIFHGCSSARSHRVSGPYSSLVLTSLWDCSLHPAFSMACKARMEQQNYSEAISRRELCFRWSPRHCSSRPHHDCILLLMPLTFHLLRCFSLRPGYNYVCSAANSASAVTLDQAISSPSTSSSAPPSKSLSVLSLGSAYKILANIDRHLITRSHIPRVLY